MALILVLIPLGAGTLAAQDGIPVPAAGEDGDDSIAVSPLDEQFAGSGEADGLERDAGAVVRVRRAEVWSIRWRMRATAVLQEPAGYAEGAYAGDRLKSYQRLVVRRGELFRFGILTDKDPGESSHADFISGVVAAGGLPGGTKITAGDYRLRAGQGLLFGSARAFGKGAAVIEPALRDGWGIPDGLSSDEVHFFRGVALESYPGPVSVLLFGSVRRLSPRLSGDGRLLGVDESGYHRSLTELRRRETLTDRAFGTALRWRVEKRLTVGVNVIRSALSVQDAGDGGGAASPVVTRRGSVDLRLGLRPVTFFCEIVGGGSRLPWIAGALFAPSGNSRIVIVRRVFPDAPGYLRTFGFADGSTGRNEAGTYLGAELIVSPGLSAGAYLDLYSSLAPGAGTLYPPVGVDRLISLRWEPGKRFSLEARFRSRDVEATGSDIPDDGPVTPGNGVRRDQALRVGVRWSPTEGLECRMRAEHSRSIFATGGGRSQGGMVFADLIVEPARGVSVHTRLQFFAIGSWASRLYSAEPDLPGTLTNTVLSGEGARWYLICSFRPSKQLRCSVKYSSHRRDDLMRIGSGAEELPSNISEKAGFQLDLIL